MTQPASPTIQDRLLSAFRKLVRGENPNRIFFGTYEYQVESATATTFDGSPTEEALGLPPLVGVPYRPSIAGATCTPTAGTLAYVAFANADPSRPIIVAFGPTTPESFTIDASGTADIARSASGDVSVGHGIRYVVRAEDFVKVEGTVTPGVGTGLVTGKLTFFTPTDLTHTNVKA